MREKWPTIVICAIVAVLLLAYVFTFQVSVSQVAVHYRLGAPLRTINAGAQEESGWYLKLPYPIDAIEPFDKRVRVLDGKLTETQLKDNWDVIISMYASWRVVDPVKFRQSLRGDEELAERALKEIIHNETSQTVGQITFDNLVSADTTRLKFDEIEKEITENVRAQVSDKNYGVTVTSFGIRRIAIPESTTQKVFERMKAERKRIAEGYRREGETKKAEKIAEASRQKEVIIADALAEAKRIRSEGEAAEAQFYSVFAQAPELAIFLRRLEALSNISQDVKKRGSRLTFVLDTLTEPFGVLKEGPLKAGTLGDLLPKVDVKEEKAAERKEE